MTDEALILAIQEASNKQDVSEGTLPNDASSLLGQDFSESYVDQARFAPELGYEVAMRRGEGIRIGERSHVYFNLDGRELRRHRDREVRRGEEGRDRRECFRVVFPVTYLMPDGSEITGEDRASLGLAVRTWYAENPEIEERPELQYPIELAFPGNVVRTVSNNEQLRRAYASCE